MAQIAIWLPGSLPDVRLFLFFLYCVYVSFWQIKFVVVVVVMCKCVCVCVCVWCVQFNFICFRFV